MKQNVGRTDRVIRYVLAIVIIGLGIYYQSWWGLLGLVPLVTASAGSCPVYSIAGINSKQKKKEVKS